MLKPSLLQSLARPVEATQLPVWAARVRERLGVVESQIKRLEREKQALLGRLLGAPDEIVACVLQPTLRTCKPRLKEPGETSSLWQASAGCIEIDSCDGELLHPALAGSPRRPPQLQEDPIDDHAEPEKTLVRKPPAICAEAGTPPAKRLRAASPSPLRQQQAVEITAASVVVASGKQAADQSTTPDKNMGVVETCLPDCMRTAAASDCIVAVESLEECGSPEDGNAETDDTVVDGAACTLGADFPQARSAALAAVAFSPSHGADGSTTALRSPSLASTVMVSSDEGNGGNTRNLEVAKDAPALTESLVPGAGGLPRRSSLLERARKRLGVDSECLDLGEKAQPFEIGIGENEDASASISQPSCLTSRPSGAAARLAALMRTSVDDETTVAASTAAPTSASTDIPECLKNLRATPTPGRASISSVCQAKAVAFEHLACPQMAARKKGRPPAQGRQPLQGRSPALSPADLDAGHLSLETLSGDALRAWMAFFGMKPSNSRDFMVRRLTEIVAYLDVVPKHTTPRSMDVQVSRDLGPCAGSTQFSGEGVASFCPPPVPVASACLGEVVPVPISSASCIIPQAGEPLKGSASRGAPGKLDKSRGAKTHRRVDDDDDDEPLIQSEAPPVDPCRATKAASKQAQLEELAAVAIRSDTELYERLLLFEPVDIGELRQRLIDRCPELRGLGEQRLRNFLDSQGVLFACGRGPAQQDRVRRRH